MDMITGLRYRAANGEQQGADGPDDGPLLSDDLVRRSRWTAAPRW